MNNIIDELSELIGFASVSNTGPGNKNMQACANWLVQHLKSIGIQHAKLFKTSSHPVVFAAHEISPDLPTILFYGHYDVQPAEPGNDWNTPPFEAVVKENYIYGRGASDDKGQLFTHIKAVQGLLKSTRPLKVNIKFLIEGAEEIGSTGLKEFIYRNKALLHCDVAVISDTKMISLNTPAITYSLRGSLNAEVFIQTGKKDLHSGTFGGYAPDAAILLSKFISQLHGDNNLIAIPGFYDKVKIIPAAERAFMRSSGNTDERLLQDAEIFNTTGERNYTLHERSTIRPSLVVTGLSSGFQGKGAKTVIPAFASVKLNFRLVPDQQPKQVMQLFEDHIKRFFSQAHIKTIYSSFNNPVTVSRTNDYVRAAAKAYESVFRQPAKFVRSGGTIGAVEYLNSILSVPVVLMGFAQVADNMHAPNEKFYLPNLFKGIDTVIQFIENVSLINHQQTKHASAYY